MINEDATDHSSQNKGMQNVCGKAMRLNQVYNYGSDNK